MDRPGPPRRFVSGMSRGQRAGVAVPRRRRRRGPAAGLQAEEDAAAAAGAGASSAGGSRPAPARVVTSSATTRRSRGRSRRRRIERPTQRAPDADGRRRRPRRTRFRRARAACVVSAFEGYVTMGARWHRGCFTRRAGGAMVGPRRDARRAPFHRRATGKSLRRGAGFATSSSAGRVDRAPRTRTKRAGASVS